jgi:hypothetical protein
MAKTEFFHAEQKPKAKTRKSRSKEELTKSDSLLTHLDYREWRDIWRSVRHAMLGEPAIKREGVRYLPRLEGMDDDQYKSYLDGAVFFNMTYRTVTGLTGSIFRRAPRLLKAGPKLQKLSKRISKEGLSLELLTKIIAQEQLSVGRVGLLLDKVEDKPGAETALLGDVYRREHSRLDRDRDRRTHREGLHPPPRVRDRPSHGNRAERQARPQPELR